MGRAPCCSKVGLHKGPWTPREDALLTKYIQAYGEGQWKSLPKKAGLLRCGKSCRLRWVNYLRPDIKRGNITAEEDDLIIRMHSLLGNRWSLIAGRLPGRTDNEIKNYWNTHLSKKLKSNQDVPNQQEADACSAKKKKNNNNNKKKKRDKNKLEANNAEAPKIQVYMPKPIRVKALSSNNLPRTDNGCSLSTVDILNSSSCASTTNLELSHEGRKEEVMVNNNNVVWEDGEQHDDILNIEWELCHVPTATLEKLYEEYLHLLTMDV